MTQVPSLKDLAFLAIPSRVPSLKQLARAAVAANRAPLPAHTLARRRYIHTGDVVPVLVRRLWEAIWQAVAKTTNFGNDILILLTPNLEWWRRSPKSASWKLDIPRPPTIDLRVDTPGSYLKPTEDQWRFPTQGHAWNWNTSAWEHERRQDDNWNRTTVRQKWERFNIPLGAGGTQNWWNTLFPPVPINQRRINAEDFALWIYDPNMMPFGNTARRNA